LLSAALFDRSATFSGETDVDRDLGLATLLVEVEPGLGREEAGRRSPRDLRVVGRASSPSAVSGGREVSLSASGRRRRRPRRPGPGAFSSTVGWSGDRELGGGGGGGGGGAAGAPIEARSSVESVGEDVEAGGAGNPILELANMPVRPRVVFLALGGDAADRPRRTDTASAMPATTLPPRARRTTCIDDCKRPMTSITDATRRSAKLATVTTSASDSLSGPNVPMCPVSTIRMVPTCTLPPLRRLMSEKRGLEMYGSGRGLGFASGAGGAGAGLATTGFPAVGLTLLALAVVLLGFALVRLAGASRPDR
jgi:hypothetical protein